MKRPLRFCMITTFYPPYSFGGDGIFVRQLAEELVRSGHAVEIIHCRDAYRLLSGKDPAGEDRGDSRITVHGLESPWGPLSPLATQQTGLPLFKSRRIREILGQGFDVIHYHNVSLVGGPGILAYGSGIKLYSLHEYWLVCPTHVLFQFNRRACRRKRCALCSLVYRRPLQLWRYTGAMRRAIPHVDAFISPSRFAADKHREMGFTAPFHRLPYFISRDPVPAAAKESGASTTDPYFLFVGRLERLKGLQTLLPVFRNYPRARLLIAGSGNDERRLRQTAAGCSQIRFLGYRSGEELQRLTRNARALIVPSLCYETFSLVVVEAFEQKTPVIVRNPGGQAELVQESGGGIICESDGELTAAMDRMIDDPSFRDELGRRGHDAYLRKWTTGVHLKGYLALIDRIAAEKGIRR